MGRESASISHFPACPSREFQTSRASFHLRHMLVGARSGSFPRMEAVTKEAGMLLEGKQSCGFTTSGASFT